MGSQGRQRLKQTQNQGWKIFTLTVFLLHSWTQKDNRRSQDLISVRLTRLPPLGGQPGSGAQKIGTFLCLKSVPESAIIMSPSSSISWS